MTQSGLLEVVVLDLQAYEHLLVGKLLTFSEIKDARSSFVIRTVKNRAPFSPMKTII